MKDSVRAWFHLFDQGSNEAKHIITQALEGAGLNLVPIDDMKLGNMGILCFYEINSGLCNFLEEVSRGGDARVLVIATSPAPPSKEDIWRVVQAGASDVFTWNHSTDSATDVAAQLQRWVEVDELVNSPLVQNHLVGQSQVWIAALRQIVEVARFTESSVLILGESGTGKELVARSIHTLDRRANKGEFVIVDCTTIVPELSGSEFFGHERGAFTGAIAAREGAFALANNGTLFLDEVGDLPLPLQAQLLRVVQEHKYKRVGGNAWQHSEFRLLCATNRDLFAEARRGRFRSDLYYRIANWVLRLPPLRERKEDILLFAKYFLHQFQSDHLPLDLDEVVLNYLLTRDYPGNVRDLKQLVSRISHRHVGCGPITVGNIPPDERPPDQLPMHDWRSGEFEGAIRDALALGVGLKELSHAATETAIRIAVNEEGGNLQRAAHRLGVTDRALQIRRANRRTLR